MPELKEEIVSYLLIQPGILARLLQKYASLGKMVGSWLIGEKPILLIGGEPGNGKSLLMGDLIAQYATLTKHYPMLRASLALISYDRVHYLFFRHLTGLKKPGQPVLLPEGETHPDARKLISQILEDVVLFAVRYLPHTLVIVEAPFIDHRGEDLIETLIKRKYHLQIFIMQSLEMWIEMLGQPERGTSASALAMRAIHEALLKERAIPLVDKQIEELALRKSWERWLEQWPDIGRDGIVLNWNPAEDQASYSHTRAMLTGLQITPDPLIPETLQKYTLSLIASALEIYPDLDRVARVW